MTKGKSDKTRAKAEKRWTGLKEAPRGLKEWIDLANMVPRGTFLPDLHPIGEPFSWDEVVARINRLPTNLREYLLACIGTEPPHEEWCRDLKTGELTISREMFWLGEIDERYSKIRTAYWLLRMISQSKTRSIDPLETLVSILRRADLSYLRQCLYEPCGNIFYAGKSRQPGCTSEHSTKFRKRQNYLNRLEREAEEERKKKRAQTARKR